MTKIMFHAIDSGVTRVGVTRDGNWQCHPIFPEKMATFFYKVT